MQNWSQEKLARFAGIVFIVVIATGIFRIYFFGFSTDILENERQFRIGIVYDFISIILTVLLSFSFYLLLRPVNRNLALFAFIVSLMAITMKMTMLLIHFVMLRISNGYEYLITFSDEQRNAIISLLSHVHDDGFHINLVFASFAFALFYYLFFKARFIPRLLSGFAIFASLLVVISNFAIFIEPANSELLYPEYTLPNFITVITISLWLSIKGIDTSGLSKISNQTD